jgi:hypothetical protein
MSQAWSRSRKLHNLFTQAIVSGAESMLASIFPFEQNSRVPLDGTREFIMNHRSLFGYTAKKSYIPRLD